MSTPNEPFTDAEQIDTRALAATALAYVRRAEPETAAELCSTIVNRYGLYGLVYACLGWVDLLVRASDATPQPDQAVTLHFVEADTMRLAEVDDVPPRARWAGRFIAARYAMDHEQCTALVRSCHDRGELGECVWALLHIVATNLNARARQAGGQR